ncbi:hypothetical protein [Rhizorhabdus sp.]|uniref:hypothetical protein n=1 Tax=Rhizorhabdus sp. TaxID=1968843 RepID=UPI0019C796DE|nr:hypothetical protein [Rhizorhabdus sp.]MBD3762578.1 hypothetical protein [Rhizorhabdus sp.]
MPNLDDIGLQLADLFENFDGFFQTFLEGDKDEGFNSSGGATGVLGYYPYNDSEEGTVYRPCLARVIANAVASSGRGAAHIGLVDIGQYMGYLPGQTGSFVLVPVIEGDIAVRLSEQESLLLPKVGQPQALLFAQPSDDGIMVTLGAANAPIPQPPGPSEPLDLGGGGIIYAPLGEITPLNITVPVGIESFAIDVPDGLDLVVGSTEDIFVPVSLSIDFADPLYPEDPTAGPWLITGDGIPAPVELVKADNPSDSMSFDGSNYPTTKLNAGFGSTGLGIEVPYNDDPNIDRVPARLSIDFVGKSRKWAGIICSIVDSSLGYLSMNCDYGGFRLSVFGPAGGNDCLLEYDVDESEVHSYRIEWTNDPGGPGGLAELFVDGVSEATASLNKKPIVSSASAMFLNNAAGNYAQSLDGITYHSLTVGYDKPDVAYDYEPFSGTTVMAEDIVRLAVDARTVIEQQPSRSISYNAPDGPEAMLNVVVGDVELPVGRAYKAILMTYPDGIEAGPVAHPNELEMTKFTAQNVRFEDDYLFQTQPSWSECIPQGDAPVIDGIVYTCDAIRMGTYVQFQFGYHLDAETNPTEPFGDLNAIPDLFTYMVPHKWYIYDQHGELLGRVEQPNGEPLNKNYDFPIWQGPAGVKSAAYTTPANRWAPCGTIGSAVIWASHDLVDHDRDDVVQRVPIPEQIVPMASHTDFSVNGFDPRLNLGGAGSDGQMNGFGNWRSMPYARSDYESWVAAGPSGDSYTGLDGVGARGPSGAIWLKYTPFNIQGRSPITGPGGVRDDRQAIAEPVSAYLCQPEGNHIASGVSYRAIAIDYCRGYASDPFHLFEDGRNVPLFKGRQRRGIALNGHYYGAGDLGVPWANRFPIYIGRTSQWAAGAAPTKVQEGLGSDEDHPWRGLFGIDDLHAHQFPGWGSLLWKTPEFAFLQIKFFEQVKMYQGSGGMIFGRTAWEHLNLMQDRAGAWMFQHAALAWKLGSARSQRLYTRQEVMDWAVSCFDAVHDNLFASVPGVFNLPSEGQTSDEFNPGMMAVLHALNLFGMCRIDDSNNLYQQTFMRGYWIHALGCGERMGFNDALRAASDKAASVIDWLIAKWRQAIVGNLTKISTHLPESSTYINFLWTPEQVESLWPDGNIANGRMGDISLVPQTYEQLETANGVLPSWDQAEAYSLDGQGTSADLSAPFWLKNVLNLSGDDIDAACVVARARFDGKLEEQVALGAAGGSTWFRYHQGSFTPPLPILSSPPSAEPPEGFSWVVDGAGNYVFDNGDQIYAPTEE